MTSLLKTAKLVAALSLLLSPALAVAHHSTAFYSKDVIEVEGELIAVKWRNPHVVWQFKVINDAGDEEIWNMEGASTYPLKRAGVTRDLFVAGDMIKVAGQKVEARRKCNAGNEYAVAGWSRTLVVGQHRGPFLAMLRS